MYTLKCECLKCDNNLKKKLKKIQVETFTRTSLIRESYDGHKICTPSKNDA